MVSPSSGNPISVSTFSAFEISLALIKLNTTSASLGYRNTLVIDKNYQACVQVYNITD